MIKGLHCQADHFPERWESELKVAKEMNCNCIVLHYTAPGLKHYAETRFPEVEESFLNTLQEGVKICHDEGYRVAIKLHTTPGETELVGQARRYNWWQGFFQPEDTKAKVDEWFKTYFGNIVYPIAQVSSAEYFFFGNEFYLMDRYTENWVKHIHGLKNLYPGKVGYCCFFTVPIHNLWLPVLKLVARFFGKEKIYYSIISVADSGRFKFKTKTREKEFIEGVARHRFEWQAELDIAGVNIFWPVWWLREEPSVEGYKKAYHNVKFKLGLFSARVDYFDSVKWFVGEQPFFVTECFFLETDPDWGEAGKKFELYEAEFETFMPIASGWFMSFWKGANENVDLQERKFIGGKFMPRMKISLRRGFNMFSLPLKPLSPMYAADLCETLKSESIVMKFDRDRKIFIAYKSGFPKEADFELEGGEGYAIQMLEDEEIEFVGTAWE